MAEPLIPPPEGGAASLAPTGDEDVFAVVNDKTHAIEVTTGVSDATHVEIRSGLKGTEKIVTGPFRTLKNLKDDVAVKPEKEPASVKSDTAANETAN